MNSIVVWLERPSAWKLICPSCTRQRERERENERHHSFRRDYLSNVLFIWLQVRAKRFGLRFIPLPLPLEQGPDICGLETPGDLTVGSKLIGRIQKKKKQKKLAQSLRGYWVTDCSSGFVSGQGLNPLGLSWKLTVPVKGSMLVLNTNIKERYKWNHPLITL